jgi:hypothetical protein
VRAFPGSSRAGLARHRFCAAERAELPGVQERGQHLGDVADPDRTQARWQLLSVMSAGDWTVPMAADRLGTSRQAVQRIANERAGTALRNLTAVVRSELDT